MNEQLYLFTHILKEGIQFWIREDINDGLLHFLENTYKHEPIDLEIILEPYGLTE